MTVTDCPVARVCDKDTVSVTVVVPLLPSLTETSSMVSVGTVVGGGGGGGAV